MLSHVTAIRFDRLMTTGRTTPVLLSCLRSDDVEVEVIAKFSAGCDRGTNALAIEAISAMLAADLGLPVPEPVLVEIDPEVIDPTSSRQAHELARRSVQPAFGSVRLPPAFAAVVSRKRMDGSLLTQAAEVFAFDAIILNPDRRVERPNCECNGKSLAIFDHEAAMAGLDALGSMFQPYPWTAGSLSTMGIGQGEHVLFNSLRGKDVQFARFEAAWSGITDDRLLEYRAALPNTWFSPDSIVDQSLAYLAQVRSHIPAVLAEIRRVIA